VTGGTARPTPDGSPGSSQPGTEGSSGNLPANGAPEVPDPLDTGKFEGDPCLTLDSAQSNGLNLGAEGEPVHITLGEACKWLNESTRGKVQISFLSEDPRGLSAEYSANEDGKWAYFIELPAIDGYPAVARDVSDDRDNGGCPVVVGASNEIAFEVALQLSEANVGKKDPCQVAVDIAGMVLETMQSG
jgi:hypothetical protein